ncbi:unnamed protein product, partial [Closterium sp. Naga37s-1]
EPFPTTPALTSGGRAALAVVAAAEEAREAASGWHGSGVDRRKLIGRRGEQGRCEHGKVCDGDVARGDGRNGEGNGGWTGVHWDALLPKQTAEASQRTHATSCSAHLPFAAHLPLLPALGRRTVPPPPPRTVGRCGVRGGGPVLRPHVVGRGGYCSPALLHSPLLS